MHKFLYIDDENGASETSMLHGFNDVRQVSVERFPLSEYREFGKLKLELIDRAKTDSGFDGLIIDLRLDGNGEDRTDFNATSLAQELRSVSARNEMKSFPIVLCSTEEKIRQTYNSDRTSHDLFDYKISKSNANPNWSKLSNKLYSLANGYKWIESAPRTREEIFGIPSIERLDHRIVERIASFETNYDFSHFIVKNMFHQTNPLINERILAARLGVDLERTPKDAWSQLRDVFQRSSYCGLFSDGWFRWWADIVSSIFWEMSGERLAFLNASRRVAILKEVTKINELIEATPMRFCNSSEFWTICEAYKRPLDPLEGFKVATSMELKSWQENKYMSLLAILEREGYTDRGLRPHSSELDRIEHTKELFDIHD